ncbi:hypothetical protein ACJJTC_001772 [Scirpophaga incertulas]
MINLKVLKLLVLLVIIWIMSLFIVIRDRRSISSDSEIYERALRNLRKNSLHSEYTLNDSRFRVWQLLEPTNISLDIDNRMSMIKSYDIPPGVNGKPVLLNSRIKQSVKQLVRKGWTTHAFNEFVSDLIPLNRSLPDVRDDWCKHQNYSSNLPQVTVIICFHNEAWSTLLRTVHSVINMSPRHLLKEIILFDDFSTMDHLKKPLDDYVRGIAQVRLRRSTRREGLIRARILAVKYATSPVVLFLDSHCECTIGWLKPLLDRISKDPTVVASPVVDTIHDSTFEYTPQNTNEILVGGFNWKLKFKWNPIPHNVLIKRKNVASPIKTATISGGLFAINKEFFARLGYYDEGFEVWGAENLELSFKAWMCGGSLEIIPCSHVGHIFRKTFPYTGQKGSLKRNSVRLAKVWMDEYAKYYYDTIGSDKIDFGNVSKRLELRKKLKCKSFQWYLENVYPSLDLPDNYAASGQIYSISNYGGCLDSSNHLYKLGIGFLPCHGQGGNQYWVYTKDGELKIDDLCLDYVFSLLMLYICKGRTSSQVWLYNAKTHHIRHMDTQKCLQVVKSKGGLIVILKNCSTSSSQKWMMENFLVGRLNTELQMYVLLILYLNVSFKSSETDTVK